MLEVFRFYAFLVPYGFNSSATFACQSFLTPGYPNIYPGSLKVRWYLKAPSSEQVRLVIIGGKTESCCDKLEVE